MRIDIPRIMLAAPASGSGQSTVATGLMAALAASGPAQAFKVAPDNIDPVCHSIYRTYAVEETRGCKPPV